jgi:hypothetical protein
MAGGASAGATDPAPAAGATGAGGGARMRVWYSAW